MQILGYVHLHRNACEPGDEGLYRWHACRPAYKGHMTDCPWLRQEPVCRRCASRMVSQLAFRAFNTNIRSADDNTLSIHPVICVKNLSADAVLLAAS